jgi:hypothetical protein
MIKLTDILKEHEGGEYPAFMYSEKGFSCAKCKYLIRNKEEDMWVCANDEYQNYMKSVGIPENRAHYLLNPDNGQPIEDPNKWCSNWFIPKA